MKRRPYHTALTLVLALLQAGLLAAMPAAEICIARDSSGGCLCGPECCSVERPASHTSPVLKESPCCTLQDSAGAQEAAVPAVKTTLPLSPRVAFESVPAMPGLPVLGGGSPSVLSAPRIPCVTTASIPLLNSSLLI